MSGEYGLGPQDSVASSFATVLAAAMTVKDIGHIPYPEHTMGPKGVFTVNAKEGKFVYYRNFLLQFMSVCKDKPNMLYPLDILGLDPIDLPPDFTSFRRSGRRAAASTRQTLVSLDTGNFGKTGVPNPFTAGRSVELSSSDWISSAKNFALAGDGGAVSVGNLPFSQVRKKRTRTKRGRGESDNQIKGPIPPLELSPNRWIRGTASTLDPNSTKLVHRKVTSLLNKLTVKNFDSVSNQIISWANKSENEDDGRTLVQVAELIFVRAINEPLGSEMYLRLCQKMMDQISPNVQKVSIKNTDGKPIAGGQLFRKFLVGRIQEEFERGWVPKHAKVIPSSGEDEAAEQAKHKDGVVGKLELYSDQHYAAQKAKRRRLGLTMFLGELFKAKVLPERIMHRCVKKLLCNQENPDEEAIENLCKLLTTIGQTLDTGKARIHMNVYVSRMDQLTECQNIRPRFRFMLQDIVELRGSKWVPRHTAPVTIAEGHKQEAYHQRQTPRPQFGGGSDSRKNSAPMTFGPNDVFVGKKGALSVETQAAYGRGSGLFPRE